MANDRSRSDRSWRPDGASSTSLGLSGTGWRRVDSPPMLPARRSRVLRAILGILAATACYASAVWLVGWLRPVRPAGICIVRAGYLKNPAVPHNAPGWNVAQAFSTLVSGGKPRHWYSLGSGFGTVAEKPIELGPSILLAGELAKRPESTLLVYLTAHAGVDGSGPFLFRDDPKILSRPEADAANFGKLYLKDMIKRLGDLGASRKIVLILDVSLPEAEPALGMLHNPFLRKLADLEPAIAEAGNLVFFCPASPGQPTWTSHDWRQTVFGHFVVEGLKGHASRESGRIDTKGLFEYVQREVKAWSMAHRGQEQTPTLLPRPGRAPTLDLASRPRIAKAPDQGPTRLPVPDEWKARWRARWKAHAAIASRWPAALDPSLWRLYCDILLRHEALVWTLEPEKSPGPNEGVLAGLEAWLESAGAELKAGHEVPLTSSHNSLAMKAVEGLPLAPSDPLRVDFEKLWNDPKAKGPIGVESRNAFYDLLIDRVASATSPAEFARAGQLLGVLADPAHLRPTEAHFLAILLRDSPPGAIDLPAYRAAVGKALRVRRLAERVALGVAEGQPPHAEQVAPLIADSMSGVDVIRRAAEDRLFSSDPTDWDASAAMSDDAANRLGEIEAAAANFRTCVDARDRAFAELPYYSAWVARRPEVKASPKLPEEKAPPELPEVVATSKLVETLVDAWNQAHELSARLKPEERGEANDARAMARARSILGALGVLEKEFRTEKDRLRDPKPTPPVEKEFRTEKDRLRDPKTPPPGMHASILALLGTPFVEVTDHREALMGRLAESTRPGDGADREAIRAGRRAYRLALASLGASRGRETEEAAVRVGPPGVIENRAALADVARAAADPDAEDLIRAGDRIGLAQRGLLVEIGTLVDVTVREPLDRWPGPLQQADLLGRLLVGDPFGRYTGASEPAGDAPGRRDEWAKNPTKTYRRRLLQRLLLAQAQRSFDDHWYSEDDDPDPPFPVTPYFRASIDALFKDVGALLPLLGKDQGPGSRIANLQQVFTSKGRLSIRKLQDRLDPTDETSIAVAYQVERQNGPLVGEGTPVAWVAPDSKEVIEVDGLPPGWRRRAEIEGSPPGGKTPTDGRIVWRVRFPAIGRAARDPGKSLVPIAIPGSLHVEGRYRGQKFVERTDLTVHPVPDIVVTRPPPPPTGDVLVEADPGLVARYGRNEGGALAIVLDCSRSMGPRRGQPPDGPSKYREATEALRRVLRKVSRGTMVSVLAFGEEFGPGRTAANPADTIRHIRPSAGWNPDSPAQFAALMREIESAGLRTWNKSPIVRAMIRAGDDLRPARGFKTMIVLTDGKDNCFEDEAPGPNGSKPDIAETLRAEFNEADIEINIVGYKIEESEDDAARKQFRVIEGLQRPGRFYPVGRADALATTLALALKPSLRYSIQNPGNLLVRQPADLSVDHAADSGFKGIPAGGYKFVVEAGGRFEKPLTINRGDRLAVRMGEDVGGITLSRVDWTDRFLTEGDRNDRQGWRPSVLKSQAEGPSGLALWASLEKRVVAGETSLEMIRPREVWMEVRADPADGRRFQQRWRGFDAFPAPTWEVKVPDWPRAPGPKAMTPARPKLDLWWSPNQEAEASGSLSLARFGSIDEVRVQDVPTAEGRVIIESITLEDIPAGAGPREARLPSKRLVVRASCPSGALFWARPLGIRPEWSEHRFYLKAGKYTGVFWPVSADEVDTRLTGLGLVSVQKFKKQAEQDGFATRGLAADVPTTGDDGPPTGRVDDGLDLRPLPGPAGR
jgi:hypothetical protein